MNCILVRNLCYHLKIDIEPFEELITFIFLVPRFQLWLILYIVSCILLASPLYHFAIIRYEQNVEKDKRGEGLDLDDEDPMDWVKYFWYTLMAIFYIIVPILFASLLYVVFSSGNFLSQLYFLLMSDRIG